MPTLRGTLDVFGKDPAEPCRWCGEPTFTRLTAEGSSLGPVPLHPDCGAEVIFLYHDLQTGRIAPADRERLRRLQSGNE